MTTSPCEACINITCIKMRQAISNSDIIEIMDDAAKKGCKEQEIPK